MSTPPPLGMSSPPPPPPPPPSSRKGCFIALGVVLVLVLILCMGACFFISRAPGKLTAWGFDTAKPEVMKVVDSSVSADDRNAFDAEYSAYTDWVRNMTPESMQGQSTQFVAPFQYLQGAMQDKSITSDEITRFIEMSRELRGVPKPDPVPASDVVPMEAEPLPMEDAPDGETPATPAETTP